MKIIKQSYIKLLQIFESLLGKFKKNNKSELNYIIPMMESIEVFPNDWNYLVKYMRICYLCDSFNKYTCQACNKYYKHIMDRGPHGRVIYPYYELLEEFNKNRLENKGLFTWEDYENN